MAYTANTPLGSDQILTTQPRILGNFQFLPVGIGLEHNFNAAGTGSDMYHLQASMPNLGGIEPIVPPIAGTDGMYYVRGGIPKFVNASGNFPIAFGAITSYIPFNGSFNLVSTIPQNIPGITGNVGGFISAYRNDQIVTTNNTSAFFQNSASTPVNVVAPLAVNGGGISINIFWNAGNLSIVNTSGSNKLIKFFGWYYPTV